MRLEVSKVCRSSLLILAVAHLGGYVVGQVKLIILNITCLAGKIALKISF